MSHLRHLFTWPQNLTFYCHKSHICKLIRYHFVANLFWGSLPTPSNREGKALNYCNSSMILIINNHSIWFLWTLWLGHGLNLQYDNPWTFKSWNYPWKPSKTDHSSHVAIVQIKQNFFIQLQLTQIYMGNKN